MYDFLANIYSSRAMAGYNVAIPGISMTLIEVDGGNFVAGAELAESIGVLYPGERMDVIVQRQSNDVAGQSADTVIVALDKE